MQVCSEWLVLYCMIDVLALEALHFLFLRQRCGFFNVPPAEMMPGVGRVSTACCKI